MRKPPKQIYPLFRSSKTSVPVPYRYQWHHDALVQATLSPDVDVIERLQGERPQELDEFAFATFGTGAVVHGTLADWPVPANMDFNLLCREHVLEGSRAEAAREIWRYRDVRLSPALRTAAMRHIHVRETTDLLALIEATEAHAGDDPFDVLRLVCDGILTVDLERGVMPDVQVTWAVRSRVPEGHRSRRRDLPLRTGTRRVVDATKRPDATWEVVRASFDRGR